MSTAYLRRRKQAQRSPPSLPSNEELARISGLLAEWAARFHAPDPEAAAQDILVKGLTRVGFDYPDSYWITAAHNEARTQQVKRSTRLRYVCSLEERPLFMPQVPPDEGAADRIVLAMLADDPDAQWLLDYYRSLPHSSPTDRKRAHDKKVRLKKRYGPATNGGSA